MRYSPFQLHPHLAPNNRNRACAWLEQPDGTAAGSGKWQLVIAASLTSVPGVHPATAFVEVAICKRRAYGIACSESVTENQQDLRKRRRLLMKDFTEDNLRGNSVGLEKGILRQLNYALMPIQRRLDEGINAFNYLGAIRHYPSRHVVLGEQSDDLPTALGEDTWKTLQTDPGLRHEVNKWLSDECWLDED